MSVLSPDATIDPFPGTRFTPVATPRRGTSRTSMWLVEIDPGTPPAPHQVTNEEIFFVLDGAASVVVAGEPATAGPGQAVVIPADTDFAIGNGGSGSLRMLCVLPVGGQARTSDGATFTPPWAL
ncbi:MAG: cupin domain-containing protein [Dermatophilaceae bacterium]